ncbi:MAG: flagellar hook-basal body complex protein, partial [bacterium]
NAHKLTGTFTNLSGTQMAGRASVPPTLYDENTWRWEVAVDPSDTTVSLMLDNVTYTDPISGQTIRASHSGIMHFTQTGSLDFVTYGDANTLADLTAWDASVTNDADAGSIIGFEGAGTIASGDSGAGANSNAISPALGGGIFDNPIGDTPLGFPAMAGGALALSKLPIVLAFQTPTVQQAVAGGIMGQNIFVPPASNIAGAQPGRLVQLQYTLATGNPEMNAIAGVVKNAAYVQAFNIDWGTVSTIQNADFDNYADNTGGVAELGAPNGDGQRDQIVDAVSGFENGAAPVTVRSLNNGGRDGLTQDATGFFANGVYNPVYTAVMRAQNGYASGTLLSLSVDVTGKVLGAFTNGQNQELAQVAMAAFQNPSGLAKVGDAHFATTINSGTADVGTALTSTRGSIVGGVLEQSNVDLSEQLTNMIVAQRGFVANARLITTSDRILDTLVNLGR